MALPNDTAWRKATVGDLTGAFSFESPSTTVPALPTTNLVNALTYPECLAAVATEIPGNPPLAYLPPLENAAIPTQEPAPNGVRRPTGLAACSAAPAPPSTVTTKPATAPARSGRLPATGGGNQFGWAAAVLGAAYGLVSLRRRRERPVTEETAPTP